MENEVKEPAPKFNYISPEEYLEMERASDTRHEYYEGQVFAISGATWEHNVIVKNINTLVLPFLKDKPCDMFGSDLRIFIPGNTLYTYPDFSIICGKPDITDQHKDTITNPSAIIEVLPRSTRQYDRGTKFHLYRSIPTLQEYIMIDSTSVHLEIYRKQNDNSWLLTEHNNISDTFDFSTISYNLQLKNIYEDVFFDE